MVDDELERLSVGHHPTRPTAGHGPRTLEVVASFRAHVHRQRTGGFVAEPDRWVLRLAEVKQPFGAWPQYAQVLLLSNEFAFID